MPDPLHSSSKASVIELLVRNHPGVMVHVASLFARRAFNLEGILCGPLRDTEISRMLLLVGAQVRLDQVVRHLEKLHDVLEVNERPDIDPELFEPVGWGPTSRRASRERASARSLDGGG
jgi:acetolactate synthase-1/3 small subunit